MTGKAMSALVDLGVLTPKAANWFQFLFACMGSAEDEIAAAKKKYPRKYHAAIDATFKHACATDMLRKCGSDSLYRAHVRELIDRIAAGADLRPGTDAEVLAMLSEMSYIAMLTREVYAVYLRLFSKIYPQHMKAIGNPNWRQEEPWPGRTDELLGEFRRKLTNGRALESKTKKKKGATEHAPISHSSQGDVDLRLVRRSRQSQRRAREGRGRGPGLQRARLR